MVPLVEQRAGEAQIVAIEEVLGDQHRAVGELIASARYACPSARFAPGGFSQITSLPASTPRA
jgi:hypothetical protein